MSTGFAQLAAAPDVATPDPSKHVNYTLGMLLGVDDFNQEFAYLSGRDQWMARDLVGYGTICGLRVSLDQTVKGPRLSVTSGTALSPRGQLICVRPAQCAYLNDWLTANEQAVQNALLSPPGSSIKLYLVVCYRDCPVDPVPIAGEPCRSADDLMAPSRLVDDFRLELRLTPPVQSEEDAIRDFVSWMNQIEITDTGPFTSLADFENALRAALATVGSPPDPGTIFQLGSPLAGIRIHPADVCTYMQAAFRIWVAEIRPLFHATWPSAACSSGDGSAVVPPPTDECLLLAELDVPLVHVGPGQNWQVDGTNPVTINENRRPAVLHTRLLQELLLCGRLGPTAARGDFVEHPKGLRYEIVAAGAFDQNGTTIFSYNKLMASRPSPPTLQGLFVLIFDGYTDKGKYIVKGTPLTGLAPPQTFEVVPPNGPNGISILVGRIVSREPVAGFMVEISQVLG